MAAPQRSGRGERRPRSSKLTLGLGTALAVLALSVGAVVLVAAADGPPPRGDTAAASSNGSSPGVQATATAPRPTPTPTPEPGQAPVAEPADSDDLASALAPGGDLPTSPGTPPSPAGGTPENVNLAPEFGALQDALAAEIASYAARTGNIDVAVAVTDLQTGKTISVNGNASHRAACTINMFALFAAVGEFEAGRADPGQVASNIRIGIGNSYPPEVKRFLEKVFPSYEAGVARGQEMMRSWGMVASAFHQVPYYPTGPYINNLTALEVNLALTKLYRGEMFSPGWTAYTLARLREISGWLNYILPARLPASATVAHKIGFYRDWDGAVNNDAGIVTFTGSDGREKAYAITYLAQRAPSDYAAYSFGARLSRIVWDWFWAEYRLGTPSAPSPTPAPTPAPTAPPPPPPPPEPTPPPAEPTPQPTATPEPTPTPTPTAEPTPTPSPTPSPTPVPTPTATAEPTPTP